MVSDPEALKEQIRLKDKLRTGMEKAEKEKHADWFPHVPTQEELDEQRRKENEKKKKDHVRNAWLSGQ